MIEKVFTSDRLWKCLSSGKKVKTASCVPVMSITISVSTRKREWASSLFSLDTNHFPKLRELAWISDITSSRSLPQCLLHEGVSDSKPLCRKFRLSEYFLPLFCFFFLLAAHGICIISLGDLFTTFRQSPLRPSSLTDQCGAGACLSLGRFSWVGLIWHQALLLLF